MFTKIQEIWKNSNIQLKNFRFHSKIQPPTKQDHGSEYTDEAGKIKHSHDNPFIEPVHGQTVVDMKGIVVCGTTHDVHVDKIDSLSIDASIFFADVMVLNDIIEQAGRHSRASDHGGKYLAATLHSPPTPFHPESPSNSKSV